MAEARVYRRRGSIPRLFRAFRRIPESEKLKLLREMLKTNIAWRNRKMETRQISVLCSRLQIPPEKFSKLFEEKRSAAEVIQELQEIENTARQAGLTQLETKIIFEKAPTIKQATQYIRQRAEMAQAAAA